MRVTTIRLSDEDAELLEAIARAEGTTMSEEIRKAIQDRIEAKRKDPDFKQRLKDSMERDRRILERLRENS